MASQRERNGKSYAATQRRPRCSPFPFQAHCVSPGVNRASRCERQGESSLTSMFNPRQRLSSTVVQGVNAFSRATQGESHPPPRVACRSKDRSKESQRGLGSSATTDRRRARRVFLHTYRILRAVRFRNIPPGQVDSPLLSRKLRVSMEYHEQSRAGMSAKQKTLLGITIFFHTHAFTSQPTNVHMQCSSPLPFGIRETKTYR